MWYSNSVNCKWNGKNIIYEILSIVSLGNFIDISITSSSENSLSSKVYESYVTLTFVFIFIIITIIIFYIYVLLLIFFVVITFNYIDLLLQRFATYFNIFRLPNKRLVIIAFSFRRLDIIVRNIRIFVFYLIFSDLLFPKIFVILWSLFFFIVMFILYRKHNSVSRPMPLYQNFSLWIILLWIQRKNYLAVDYNQHSFVSCNSLL